MLPLARHFEAYTIRMPDGQTCRGIFSKDASDNQAARPQASSTGAAASDLEQTYKYKISFKRDLFLNQLNAKERNLNSVELPELTLRLQAKKSLQGPRSSVREKLCVYKLPSERLGPQ